VIEAGGRESIKDAIEVNVGTQRAKTFIDQLMSKPFFSRENFSVAIRQPRSLISKEELKSLTKPLVEPSADVFEELWQFSQVTYGFVIRILIGGLLLAYGLVGYRLLFIIAGLLFIPLLPLMLSVGFGAWTRQWRLALQGVISLAVAIISIGISGMVVALFSHPPVQYSEFNSIKSGFVFSFLVGIAAGLATADDVGRREMIGLAATAQVAVIPAWFGSSVILGFPLMVNIPERLLALLVNIGAIAVSACVTYALIGIKGSALNCFKPVTSTAVSNEIERRT
jgi:hypothetical protein